MIKVLHCISDTNFGGAGRVLLNYLAHFDTQRFKVFVVLPKGSKLIGYLDSEKYEIIEFDGLYDRSYNRQDASNLKKLIKTLDVDIIHSHGALSARIAGKRCKKKVVYTRHSVFDLPKWQTSFLGRTILGSVNNHYADRIIAVSPAAKDLLVSTGTKAEKIDTVFNGVERLERKNDVQVQEFKHRFEVSEDDFVCSIIARLEEVKGHKYLIEAASLLKEKKITDVKILIAGTGGIEQELKDYARQMNVLDIVRFVGFISDIPLLLSATDLQINASYGTEATSMALLEGFSMGIPAVVSDFGGNPYVVHNGKNGLVFPKKNSKEICDAILKMKNEKTFMQSASKASQKIFDEIFTAQKMTEQMEQVYFELLGEE